MKYRDTYRMEWKNKEKHSMKMCEANYKNKKIGFYFMLVYSVCTEQVGEISKHRSKSLLWYFFFFPSLLSLVIWYVECNLVLANYPQWRWHAWIVFICFHSSVGSFFSSLSLCLSRLLWLCIFLRLFLNEMSPLSRIFRTKRTTQFY